MKWIDQFRLTSTEKKGFLALAVLLCSVLLFRVAIVFWPERDVKHDSELLKDVAIWEAELREKLVVRHRFNPNKVSEAFIADLVLSKFAKANWVKFLEKKRLFRTKADLQNLYGMDSAWFAVNQDSIFFDVEIEENTSVSTTKYVFDPNLVSKAQMLELGFPDWLANRIIAYREKGGKFKTAADLQKIYNFPSALFIELEPFIKIKSEQELSPQQEEAFVIIEINSADSLALLTIKGIGPAFANRILKYRTQLGGFAWPEQLLEIYGIDEEKFNGIKESLSVDAARIIQLAINKEEFKVLLKHPYLNYQQVKSIVGYREKIGPINKITDLKQLEGFTEKDIARLIPYLSVK